MRERWSGGGSDGVTISSTEQRSLATNTKPDRQTDRQADRQTKGEGEKGGVVVVVMASLYYQQNKGHWRQTPNRQIDRQTDRQTDRQKERERKVEWWW